MTYLLNSAQSMAVAGDLTPLKTKLVYKPYELVSLSSATTEQFSWQVQDKKLRKGHRSSSNTRILHVRAIAIVQQQLVGF